MGLKQQKCANLIIQHQQETILVGCAPTASVAVQDRRCILFTNFNFSNMIFDEHFTGTCKVSLPFPGGSVISFDRCITMLWSEHRQAALLSLPRFRFSHRCRLRWGFLSKRRTLIHSTTRRTDGCASSLNMSIAKLNTSSRLFWNLKCKNTSTKRRTQWWCSVHFCFTLVFRREPFSVRSGNICVD